MDEAREPGAAEQGPTGPEAHERTGPEAREPGAGGQGELVEVDLDDAGGGAGPATAALPCDDAPGPGPGAPVVVLLHAFPLDRSMWDDVVPLLAHRCRVLAVDLPGLGTAPVPGGDPDLGVAVDGVLALLDAEGVSSAVVAGLSTGGYVAAQLAGRAPERVAGLALASTTTRVGPPDDPDERRRTAERVLGREGLDAVMGSVDEGLSEQARAERPELAERVAATIARQRPAGVAWVCRALAARPDTTDALAGFPGPVLLLFGERDGATPPQERGRQMHDVRPDARLVVVPGSGHLTALEAPRETADALLDLVDAAGAGGSGA
ncbi:alpha/beta fold hydrolase [uncultured Pseudokineococcus sp.]|uniref:alpha/beta fold hydrolase n=1 Tax=uncultured Pseudokineococcus sp. TaxID=1642928 RepID=UPI002616DE7B|nr:alpha/beta fold hydrolase [uncultured Pseudokineococcus sp.]